MGQKAEDLNQKKQRAAKILIGLKSHYPDAKCSLTFESDWELLVSGILSAQCTDERVNIITPALFAAFPTVADMAVADQQEIENLIRSCGIYRNKAKAIKGSAQKIVAEFDSELPRTRDELLSLPGVGRKIANLILGDAFGEQAIVVDTHCARISKLLGMTDSTNPLRIEKDLEAVLAYGEYNNWGHLMVFHGRNICRARCRNCTQCPVIEHCAYGSNIDITKYEAGDCV